jgi:outer membrane protein assembly factor BamE (lipoprotein component of BamABCDE complex)
VSGCVPTFLGRPFSQNPLREVKVGFDQKKDVLRKLGTPYRQHADEYGNTFFVYVWSDGAKQARKCVVMFNSQGLVSIVNVVQ